MARVSLILPTAADRAAGALGVEPWRVGLERAGHEVEILIVGDADSGTQGPWSSELEESPGLAAAAVAGLRHASGEILLVLDTDSGYGALDLARVVEPLVEGRAELAIATSGVPGPEGTFHLRRGPVQGLLRKLVGTSAPTSGLIGLTREALDPVRDAFRPVGGTFAFELLARIQGRWVEVPVARADPRAERRRPGVDDVRQWKRLADHRFGNASRLVQYCAVGGSGVIVDLACFLALQPIFATTSLAERVVPPSKVSAALFGARVGAIAVALCWNFLLNRRLTFSYARSGSIVRQFATYALGNAPGIALNLLTFFGLTRKVAFFDQHKLAAALIGIVAATAISFPMSRWVAFKDRGEIEVRPRSRTRRGPTRTKAAEFVGRPNGDAPRI